MMSTSIAVRCFRVCRSRIASCALTVRYISEEKKSYGDEVYSPKPAVNRKPRFQDVILQARIHENGTDSLQQQRTVVLEGERLIRDAIRSGGHVDALYFSSREVLRDLGSSCPKNTYFVPKRILKTFSKMKTFPGIMAVFRIPAPEHMTTNRTGVGMWRPLPVTLILNRIADPGNMGSLLRTATAFGLTAVLISKGSVDVWNEKVVRAGMSAHFRIPIYQNLQWTDIGRWLEAETVKAAAPGMSRCMPVYLADVATSTGTPDDMTKTSSPTLSRATDTDSDADVTSDTEDDELSSEVDFQRAFQAFAANPSPSAFNLPLSKLSHWGLEYFALQSNQIDSQRKVALVMGSEASGLSAEAYYLAHLSGGSCVTIPSNPQTESINCLSAASAILGEMQRQHSLNV